jgi:hypothetical protein
MATNTSSNEQTCTIRIDIDGEKHLLKLSHSSSAAELRNILFKRYQISSNAQILDADGYALHSEDEVSFTVSQLLNKENVVKLVTKKSETPLIAIPERQNKACEKKLDLKYAQTLSQSTRINAHELKLPGSTSTRSENKIVVATDLDRDMWEKSNDNYPRFQVTDDSNIRAYMKDKEMHSSFLSGKFFDGGIDVSSPLIGIGINAEYLKSKATTNVKKKTYLTYCFNFPRVTLQLDLSYLEPTTEFIEAIDTVLMTHGKDAQMIKLEEVLSTYGHVYPRLVVLGGHLYHTEAHDNLEKAEEAKNRLSADVHFSVAVIKSAKIHAGGGSEKQSQNKSSEQTSLLTFEAVGGDTRFNRDPTLWTNTIADPFLWRVIEQDNYESIITLLDKQRQQKVQKIFNSYTMQKIFPSK